MSDTHRPATGSKKGKPAIAPPIPASATTLDSASLRWWWALAIRTSLRARAPTFTVARNSASLDTSDTSAAASAIEPGPGAAAAALAASAAAERPTSTLYEWWPMPAPVAQRRPATLSAPTLSYLPWPKGWSSSGGFSAARRAQSVTKSPARSPSVWPASAILSKQQRARAAMSYSTGAV